MKQKSQNVQPKTVQEFNSIMNQRHVSFNKLLKENFTKKPNHIKKWNTVYFFIKSIKKEMRKSNSKIWKNLWKNPTEKGLKSFKEAYCILKQHLSELSEAQ